MDVISLIKKDRNSHICVFFGGFGYQILLVSVVQRTARTRWTISGTALMIIESVSCARTLSSPSRPICCSIGGAWHRPAVRCRYSNGSHQHAVRRTLATRPTLLPATVSLVMA